jgi:cytochrome c oxidase cbb3-type subunit III
LGHLIHGPTDKLFLRSHHRARASLDRAEEDDLKNRSELRFVEISFGLALAACALFAHSQATQNKNENIPQALPGTEAPAVVHLSHQDPAAVQRGGVVFASSCASCHGTAAKGTDTGPDLVGSALVEDDEKGNMVSPILQAGHPVGKPKLDLTDSQISDVVAWLRVQVYGAAFRQTYTFLDVLVGDPQKGQAYFNAKCVSCHSATGDLAGIGGKFNPPNLQFRWLSGGGGGRERTATFSNGSMIADTSPPHVTKSTTTVTVTLASGQSFTGVPILLTDFNVVFKDMSGGYHSYSRAGDFPKVEVHNPLQVHTDMMKTLSDDDMHNVTAYLATLK